MSGAISAVSAAGAAAAAGGAGTLGVMGAALSANAGLIGLGLSGASMLAGAGAKSYGTIAQGNATAAADTSAATQATANADEARATGEAQQQNALRQGEYANSRAAAVIAASGANPDSVTAVQDQTNITGQSQYGALTALFNGEQKARGLDYQATTDLQKGAAAQQAGNIAGYGGFASTIAGMAGQTMYSKNTDPFSTSSVSSVYPTTYGSGSGFDGNWGE